MKKEYASVLCGALVCAAVFAAEPNKPAPQLYPISTYARERLWPEGKMPDADQNLVAAMGDETKMPDYRREEHRRPFVAWCPPPVSNRTDTCVILISGGGYWSCCDSAFIEGFRKRFTDLGIQCVNLVYRTPRPKGLPFYKTAWEDGQRAVRLVRSQAAAHGCDPEKIGAIAISAGSHLATLLATSSQTPAYEPVDELDKTPCHLNWAITCAIAYAVTDGLAVPNVRGGDAPDAKLDSIFKFDAKTCPMCMFHGGNDDYSPMSSTFVYRRLRAAKVPAELHLFADRPHSFYGYREGHEFATGYDNWFKRAEEFLRQMKFIPPLDEPVLTQAQRFPDDSARASYEKEFIWPDGKMPEAQTNQGLPYVEWHMPKELKTKAIQMIYSGGGYGGNTTMSFEVYPVRRFLNAKGMAVVTLRYRTPRPDAPRAKHDSAWQDLQRAIRLVRKEAPARGLDPNRIGIMGSSAGGHLTLMGATSARHRAYFPVDDLDKISADVQWAIAIYPAYALTDGLNGPNSGGGNDDSAVLAPEFAFDVATCPMLFIHGDADGYAAMNSVKCWEKLRRMGVQSDLHTLALRKHCFMEWENPQPGTGSYTWVGRIWEFMSHKGFNR